MISKSLYNIYVALQVTLNVNIQFWKKNGVDFTAESVLPMQFIALKKHNIVLKIIVALNVILTRYFYWLWLPVFFLQMVRASLLLLFIKNSARKANLCRTVLFYGSERLFQTYRSSGRKDKCTLFCVSKKIISLPEGFEDCAQILFWDLINIADIWQCTGVFCALLKMQHRHAGNQYVLGQALGLLLVEKALRKYPELERVIFCNVDRWSYVCSALQGCEKIFMQHGLLSARVTPLYFLYKWQEISLFYGYAAEQAKILFSLVRRCGRVEYFKPQLHLQPLRHRDNRKGILLICCSALFLAKEIEIIKQYSTDPDVVLYVKPHPVYPDKPYIDLHREYDFILIGEKDYFPDVDQVIAYSSTLAYEYELCGKKVFIHSEW